MSNQQKKRATSITEVLGLESKSKIYNRFVTYLSFFLLMFVVGVPTWYSTTSIPKEDLMIDRMLDYESNIYDRIHVIVPVYVDLPTSDEKLLNKIQSALTESNEEAKKELHLKFEYEIKLIENNKEAPVNPSKEYLVKIQSGAENMKISSHSKEITITVGDITNEAETAQTVAKSLINEVFIHEMKLYSPSHKKNQIAFETGANYHLSFFLLNGDGNYISWNFKDFFDTKMAGFMGLISTFANFTVDSQIEYYSALTNTPHYNSEAQGYVLSEEDTSVFVNHEKWNLDHNILLTSSNDKSLIFLNMILYVPSKKFQPLYVGNSNTNSFINPQYGGIQILNLNSDPKYSHINDTNTLESSDLEPIFEIFVSQILTLLGLPKNPKSPYIRLDFLTKYFIINNLVKSTGNLGSLVRLIKSLPSISIPNNTGKHVQDSFDSIEESLSFLRHGELKKSCDSANVAIVKSNLAFFEKEMVQQIYFPDEHKFAVYSPLLGPISTILLLGLIRLLQDVKVLKKHYGVGWGVSKGAVEKREKERRDIEQK